MKMDPTTLNAVADVLTDHVNKARKRQIDALRAEDCGRFDEARIELCVLAEPNAKPDSVAQSK